MDAWGVRKTERGQASVEAALIVPIWLLITLGALQLALVQQARLMTEYAAHSAARAGIVWNGNTERMRDAALFALLPTFGGAGDLEGLGSLWHDAVAQDAAVARALGERPPRSGVSFGAIRIDSPRPIKFPAGALERDFDEEELLLDIRVRYLFELRLPFADGALFAAWAAVRWVRPDPTLTASEVRFLSTAARGQSPLGPSRRYFLPLAASRVMKMQSNPHRKWFTAEEVP